MTEQLYERIPRERLYEHIASHIEELIVAGKLTPGDQLPPERELARQMQVGRGAIRESVKLLAERGLVEVLPGRGTFVVEPDVLSLTAQLDRFLRIGLASFNALMEVRSVLEVATAGLAAQRATEEDLERLEAAVIQMDQNLQSPAEYVAAHLSFHRCLAEATVEIEARQQEFVPTAEGGWEESGLSAFVDDLMVDIDGIAREALVLALPAQVLCSDMCRGLCPQCGRDLNQGTCKCGEHASDERWNKLKDLKLED